MGDIAKTDVVALSRRYLLSLPSVTDVLNGEGRVGSHNRPPYPRVRLTDPPGSDRFLEHLLAPVMQVEVLGDPGQTGQKPVLRNALYVVLRELRRLPEVQALDAFSEDFEPDADDPVVTYVQSTGGGGYVPEPPNQPRYLAMLTMHVHPPRD